MNKDSILGPIVEKEDFFSPISKDFNLDHSSSYIQLCVVLVLDALKSVFF